MTAAATRTFPGGRTVLGWQRELAGLHPRRLWFSHWLVHRVEAPVAVARVHRLDPFPRGLLRALFADADAAADLAAAERLRLDRPLRPPLLRELADAGLLRRDGDAWTLTPAGRDAWASGGYPARAEERRVFYFVDNQEYRRPPSFAPLAQEGTPLPAPPEGWRFDPEWLAACVRQPAEWKARHGFPAEVEALLTPDAEGQAAGWRRVLFDRAEHAPLLLAEVPEVAGGTVLYGFLVRPEQWVIRREAPALVWPGGWREALPDLAEDPPTDAWRQAWLAWCHTRHVPANEAEACRLERVGDRLRVTVSRAFVEHLKTSRHELMRGETCLLAAAGRTQAAARVEVVEG